MQNYSDLELVDLYKQSNQPEYLGELFARHSEVMYRTAIRIMKEPSDADDIMQVVCCKMIKDLKNFNGTGSIVGWILKIVIHSCYNQKQAEKSRRNRDHKFMSERVQVTESKNYEMSEMIETHLNKLPEKYKIPISLQIMEGLSIKEVSDSLSLPEKTIRTQIARGLEKLKASLGNAGFTASITGLSEMLINIKQPAIPEIFKSNQYFNSVYHSKAAVSAKIPLVTKAISSWSIKSLLLLILSVSVIFAGISMGYLKMAQDNSLQKNQELTSGNILGLSSPLSLTHQKWAFEREKELQDFKFIKGRGVIAKGKGVNGSNCLDVEKNTLIEIDISKYKLPLKISFSFDTNIADNSTSNGIFFLKNNYQENKNIFYFNKLSHVKNLDLSKNRNRNRTDGYFGEWLTSFAYISDECVDLWLQDKRMGLIYGTSVDNKKLYFSVYDKSLIENLVIESIDLKSMPDISKFAKFVHKVPFKKGFKEFFNLTNENESLGLDKNAAPVLGYSDKENMEKALGLSLP